MPPVTELARRRIRFTLHYDGAEFAGWQVQPGRRTVQGEVERVLGRLFAAPVTVLGSGRTDRGVHATGQVATVDAPVRWTADSLQRAMNALLPCDVWVKEASEAAATFHPRYDAVSRAYMYRVGLAPDCRSPFHAHWCWPLAEDLDVAARTRAAAFLLGDHSFRAFAKAGQEERGDRCTVTIAEWHPWQPVGVEFHIAANRFLHHMVRYLVGTLVSIGRGLRPERDIEELLAPTTQLVTSPPAPPEGLFLREVRYP